MDRQSRHVHQQRRRHADEHRRQRHVIRERQSRRPVENGDTITFQWRSSDVACAGGVPRVFIQGGAYNTFDQDPAGPGACGTAPDGDGWRTVTGTISGITNGIAGHTGIVNDNPSDPGTIQVRNLVIAGVSVLPPGSKQGCKKGGWKLGGYKNQGQCIKAMKKAGSKGKSKSKDGKRKSKS